MCYQSSDVLFPLFLVRMYFVLTSLKEGGVGGLGGLNCLASSRVPLPEYVPIVKMHQGEMQVCWCPVTEASPEQTCTNFPG